jgi:hypothetical protein
MPFCVHFTVNLGSPFVFCQRNKFLFLVHNYNFNFQFRITCIFSSITQYNLVAKKNSAFMLAVENRMCYFSDCVLPLYMSTTDNASRNRHPDIINSPEERNRKFWFQEELLNKNFSSKLDS